MWTTKSAFKHTKKADTAEKKKVWVDVANRTMKKEGSDAGAIRLANYVVKRMKGK